MMDVRNTTIDDLLKAGRLAVPIVDVLHSVRPNERFSPPLVDLSAYLVRAAVLGEVSTGNANRLLADTISTAVGRGWLAEFKRMQSGADSRAKPPSLLSHGLRAAFEDAFAMRARTGGKDSYIGARHVFASLVSAQDPVIESERQYFYALVGGRDFPSRLRAGVAEWLKSNLEPNEDPQIWAQIFSERGLDDLAKLMLSLPDEPTKRKQARTPPKKKGPSPQSDSIAAFLNDNPLSIPLGDLVGVDAVAGALARLIASKNFRPPLAVGVFGPWGSGKSLLMRRMQEAVDVLTKSGDGAFYADIVPITFNAWHYVDTDLWASLAGSIFEELDSYARRSGQEGRAVFDQLSTARSLTLEAARGLAAARHATRRAEESVRTMEARLSARRTTFAEKLIEVQAAAQATSAAGKTWFAGDKEARNAVQATYGKSLEEMAGLWASPKEVVESLQKSHLVWLEIFRAVGRWRTLGLVAFVTILGLGLPFAASFLKPSASGLAEAIKAVKPWISAATVFLATAASLVTAFTRRAVVARDAIVAAMEVYQQASVKGDAGQDLDLENDRKQLLAARDELERARTSLVTALSQQAEADIAFAGDTPAGRLRSFVESRAGPKGVYRSSQGLISTIRRDFRDLAALMNPDADAAEAKRRIKANEDWNAAVAELQRTAAEDLSPEEFENLRRAGAPNEEIARPFNRIVLYIDDLDRCPPTKVLEVLQAVHLLLAHSLFVVVVAVDVRWLTGALEKVYPELLEKAAGDVAGKAAALDYLEKIFQLPVWTEAIPASDAAKLIRSSLASQLAEKPTVEAGGEKADAAPEGKGTGQTGEPGPGTTGQPPPETSTSAIRQKVDKAASVVLKLEEFEIDHLASIAERLSCSPRRLVRLANTYRVARAGVSVETAQRLLDGGYRGFGLLLALAAAFPRDFPAMAGDLSTTSDWRVLTDLWAKRLQNEPRSAAAVGELGTFLRPDLDIGTDIRPWIPLARRFSFTG